MRALVVAVGLLLPADAFPQDKPERPSTDGVDEVKVGRDLTNLDRQKERFKDRTDAYQKFLDIILKNQITKKPDVAAQKTELLTIISAAKAGVDTIVQQRKDNQPTTSSLSVLRNQLSDFSRKSQQNVYRDSIRMISSQIEKTFGEKLELILNSDARQDLITIKSDIDEKTFARFEPCRPADGTPAIGPTDIDFLLRSGLAIDRILGSPDNFRPFVDNCEKGVRDNYEASFNKTFEEYTAFMESTIKTLREKISIAGSDQAKIDSQIASLERQLREDRTKRQEVERIRAEAEAQRARAVIDPASKDTILLTLVAWGLIICVVIGAIVLLIRYQALDPQRKDFPYPIFMEMITVFLLTASILILGLAAKLNSEALAALIGAVSGYVLGKSKDGTKTT